MFDETSYVYDRSRQKCTAGLADGAYIYRLVSLAHCSPDEILTGKGPEASRESGRFNGPQQRTSYCATNILTCLSEVLYHMYRGVLRRLKDKQPYDDVVAAMRVRRALAIARVQAIDDMVFVDSEGVRVDYKVSIPGTTIVFPDHKYKPFRRFSDKLRRDMKKGVVYPSARHSEGMCFALFNDETGRLIKSEFELLFVEMSLVPEKHDPKVAAPATLDPFREKLHATMGHYRFEDPTELERLRSAVRLNPIDIKSEGMIDFVRRRYNNYPADAVL
jgi:RES domain-containing protein